MSIRNTEIQVSKEKAGQRLDQFLAHSLPNFSRAYLQKKILQNEILLNQKATRKGEILCAGDVIQIAELLEIRERIPQANPRLPISIVYIDEYLAVIEKPAGVPSHPVNHEETKTVVNWWLAMDPNVIHSAIDPLRAGIVHRLDTNTSGLLLLARTQEIVELLQNEFRNRKVNKEYLALVLGQTPESGKIDFPLIHDPKSKRRMLALQGPQNQKDLDARKARHAHTEYQVLEKFADFTLLQVKTLTGRMHQVRVHLSALGHPLVGEPIYIKPLERQRMDHSLSGHAVSRHFLHASRLRFNHPLLGKDLEFTSPLSEDLQFLLSQVAKKAS